MKSMTRIELATREWNIATEPFRSSLHSMPGQGFVEFSNLFLKSVSFIGESELYIRQAERCEALGIQPERAEYCKKRFKSLNSDGITVARKALPHLHQWKQDIAKILEEGRLKDKVQEFVKKNGSNFRNRIAEELVNAELKKQDVQEIDAELANVIDVVSKKGALAGIDLIDQRLLKLIEFRKSPGRGAEKNAAPWKLIAVIAILIALGLAFFIHCGVCGCDIYSRDSYIAAMIVVLMLIWC